MFDAAPEPPVAKLITGMPAEEAAAMLPRIFNLCRAAQGAAARLAFGLESDGAALAASLTEEIAREHRAFLTVILPARLNLAPLSMARFPESPAAFDAFLSSDHGLAPLSQKSKRSLAPPAPRIRLTSRPDRFPLPAPGRIQPRCAGALTR